MKDSFHFPSAQTYQTQSSVNLSFFRKYLYMISKQQKTTYVIDLNQRILLYILSAHTYLSGNFISIFFTFFSKYVYLVFSPMNGHFMSRKIRDVLFYSRTLICLSFYILSLSRKILKKPSLSVYIKFSVPDYMHGAGCLHARC